MGQPNASFFTSFNSAFQQFAVGLVGVSAASALFVTMGAAVGVMPWLEFEVQYGASVFSHAGMALQISLTLLLVALCAYLPANRRILNLETSHRDFRMSMADVSEAFSACLKADLDGYFKTEGEFDAVRERFAFLREHPDLETLEPEIMELAAQMSKESSSLTKTFSTEKIERAQTFLKQRQAEIARFEAHLDRAARACSDLSALAEQIDDQENQLTEKRQDIERTLRGALRELGFELRQRGSEEHGLNRVIAMHSAKIATPAE